LISAFTAPRLRRPRRAEPSSEWFTDRAARRSLPAALVAIIGPVRLSLPAIEVQVAGGIEPAATEIVSAGAYVIAVTTVLERSGHMLASSYLSDLAGRTLAAHLWSSPTTTSLASEMPTSASTHLGRTCLLDHMARLRDQLIDTLPPMAVYITIPDATLSIAEHVWHPET
jgi:hypothetical protein